MNIIKIQEQLDENRRSVAFDSYDITVKQLYDMILEEMIGIAPEYQRHFIWEAIGTHRVSSAWHSGPKPLHGNKQRCIMGRC